jgi:hypothetical protein
VFNSTQALNGGAVVARCLEISPDPEVDHLPSLVGSLLVTLNNHIARTKGFGLLMNGETFVWLCRHV